MISLPLSGFSKTMAASSAAASDWAASVIRETKFQVALSQDSSTNLAQSYLLGRSADHHGEFIDIERLFDIAIGACLQSLSADAHCPNR